MRRTNFELERASYDAASSRSAEAIWFVVAIMGAVIFALSLAFALAGCGDKSKHPRGAAFASGAENCALDVAGAAASDLIIEAQQSAGGAPGAPNWQQFSTGELLSKGIPLAICIAEQAIAALDMRLPPMPADASGNVKPLQAEAAPRAFLSPSVPRQFDAAEVADVQAHSRLADWLSAHGATHVHTARGGR